MFSRTVAVLAEESAFGQLLVEIMKYLQLTPPRVYAYDHSLHNGNSCWYVEVDIAARLEPTPGQKIEIRVDGGVYKDTVEQAVQKALTEVARVYRRDLVSTPYLTMVEALESRARDLQRESDLRMKEQEQMKEKMQKEIRELKAQIPKAPGAVPLCRLRLRTTARKRVIRDRVQFNVVWDDEPLSTEPSLPSPTPLPLPAPVQQEEEEEEEPMEREWYSSEDSLEDTARSRFSVNFF
jgi:hypothetical protein